MEKVTAKKAGTAVITATVPGKKFNCKITVSASSSGKKSASSSGGDSGEVWIPKSGSKYHSRKTCSGMKNPTKVTLEEAKEMGYTACKKCY